MFIQEYQFLSSQNKFIIALIALNVLFLVTVIYLWTQGTDTPAITTQEPAITRNSDNAINTAAMVSENDNLTLPTTESLPEATQSASTTIGGHISTETVTPAPPVIAEEAGMTDEINTVAANPTHLDQEIPIVTTASTVHTTEEAELTDEIEIVAINPSNLYQEISKVVNSTADTMVEKPATQLVDQNDLSSSVKIYYDGDLARKVETDDEGNQHITISRSLDDLNDSSNRDASYLKALEELREGIRTEVTMSKTGTETITDSEEAATARIAVEGKGESQSVDYFNKVNLNDHPVQTGDSQSSIALQIADIVSKLDEATTVTRAPAVIPEDETPAENSGNDYLQNLNQEAKERSNAMRTIRVRRGDSLWDIAVRAYGSGYSYRRIFKANPHLINPDKIEVGDYLRVPL